MAANVNKSEASIEKCCFAMEEDEVYDFGDIKKLGSSDLNSYPLPDDILNEIKAFVHEAKTK